MTRGETFYQHGWQSWNATGWRPLTAPVRHSPVEAHRLQSTDPARLDDPHPGGSAVGALDQGSGEIRLLGSLGIDAWVTARSGGLEGEGQGPWFETTGPEMEVFSSYSRQLADALGSRRGKTGPVWCSWYSVHRDITESFLLKVLADLSDLPFEVVQTDDGWQQANGDWEPNADFASGMESLAGQIADTGRVAGLWLAPFLVDKRSAMFATNRNMLLTDGAGTPVPAAYNWSQPTYALDVTRPDVLDWLASLVTRVVGWGYRYLKLDFLYAAALPGAYHRPTGREAAYRNALQVVRDAAGDGVYLLGCGAPVVPSLGILDGLRVGPDAAPYWDNPDRTLHLGDRAGPGAADAITTSLGRFWLKPLIDIDPDVVFFRSRDCLLNRDQREMLADVARICGFRGVSDPPGWLDPDERRALEDFLVDRPEVRQLGRYRFALDGREVDFSEVAESRPW